MAHSSEDQMAFMRELTQVQRRLYAYILAFEASPTAADDILQQTNVVLLKKAEDFTLGTHFFAWASRVAYYEIKAWHKKELRQQWLVFNDDLEDIIAERAAVRPDLFEARQHALRACMTELSDEDRELVQLRYARSESVSDLAEIAQRSHGAMRQVLYRIRGNLRRCITHRLGLEGNG